MTSTKPNWGGGGDSTLYLIFIEIIIKMLIVIIQC